MILYRHRNKVEYLNNMQTIESKGLQCLKKYLKRILKMSLYTVNEQKSGTA